MSTPPRYGSKLQDMAAVGQPGACCMRSKSGQDAPLRSATLRKDEHKLRQSMPCPVVSARATGHSEAHSSACPWQVGVDYIIPHLTVNGTTSLANNPIVEIAASTGRADMFVGGNFVFNSGSNKVSNWTVGAGKQLALGCRSHCRQLVLWVFGCAQSCDVLVACQLRVMYNQEKHQHNRIKASCVGAWLELCAQTSTNTATSAFHPSCSPGAALLSGFSGSSRPTVLCCIV